MQIQTSFKRTFNLPQEATKPIRQPLDSLSACNNTLRRMTDGGSILSHQTQEATRTQKVRNMNKMRQCQLKYAVTNGAALKENVDSLHKRERSEG